MRCGFLGDLTSGVKRQRAPDPGTEGLRSPEKNIALDSAHSGGCVFV